MQKKTQDAVNRADAAGVDCIICCENTATVTFQPCGHKITCTGNDCVAVCLFVAQSLCLSLCLSPCLFVALSVCLSVCLFRSRCVPIG